MKAAELIEILGGHSFALKKADFIHSRPAKSRAKRGKNRTLQGADEQLSRLSISLQETAGFSPRSFIVRGITSNSQEVRPDYIFVAIRGMHIDGRQFIPEAIAKGAKLIITESTENKVQSTEYRVQSTDKASFFTVGDARRALGELAAKFYGNPSEKIKVVGVTGTNGKTTITYLIEAILKEAGHTPAVIGTINYRFKDKVIAAKNTTPAPVELQSLLAQMRKSGVDYAAMEVSSHALDQQRVGGIKFHSAIFTNLTHDHLDYHHCLENYFSAKAKLFKELPGTAFAVINHDDPYAARIKKITGAEVVTYGIERKSDVSADQIKFSASGTGFLIKIGRQKIRIETKLIGRHNVYNILAAVAWAFKAGLDIALIQAAMEKFSSVPGRLERIDSGRGFFIFVDYAHTDDALFNVIKSLKQVSSKRIIVVFGCGGERDRTKRPKMGCVVSELADYAVITSDNPRSENPLEIIEEIKQGIKKDNYSVVVRRREAIRKALSLARPGDTVLIAGKGHEDYQILGRKKIHFDDREAVRKCLR